MMVSAPAGGVLSEERKRKQLIVRRHIGPPRPVEEPTVPPDIKALARRREPLIDRLERIRDSDALYLSETSRLTIDEAIEILYRLGWDQFDR